MPRSPPVAAIGFEIAEAASIAGGVPGGGVADGIGAGVTAANTKDDDKEDDAKTPRPPFPGSISPSKRQTIAEDSCKTATVTNPSTQAAPIPMGSAGLRYNNLSQDELQTLQNALNAKQNQRRAVDIRA
ncbi:MAG: hypothetical protein Q9207_006749 [Kuettlingeria erythrocarpa]